MCVDIVWCTQAPSGTDGSLDEALRDVHPVAEGLFRLLSGDPEGTSTTRLAIPVRFRSAVAPATPDVARFGEARRKVVVVLVDAALLACSTELPWRRFVGELADWAAHPGHTLIPIGLDAGAVNLGALSRERNMLRVGHLADDARQDAIESCVALQLWRLLDPDANPSIFISYASADGKEIAKVLRAHLATETMLDSFLDSVSIHPGEEFSEVLLAALVRCGVVVVHTDGYARSVWCGRELVRAKALGRPVVVLHAIHAGQERAFPYLGNTAVVPWPSGRKGRPNTLRAIVRTFVVEGLRGAWFGHRVEHIARLRGRQLDRTVFARPPELLTLAGLGRDAPSRIVYPDPPLPAVEMDLLRGQVPDLDARTPTELWAL